MKIKIGNNSEYLIFTNFSPENGEKGEFANDFYNVSLQLNVNGITSNIGASIRVGELSQLYTDLLKLYDTLKYSFVFSSIEDNVNLHFTPTVTGQIEIKGYLRNSDYTGSIDFTIEADQTFMPSTIKEVKKFLESIVGEN
ncbi:WapI family immunity protein [Pontibacter arcticus]|uniref:Uncharacterized protein n=1 Tax=Pontibacter arcticus TaxID=2080288 RepID=A0A364REB5_9BACT|nr:hypothetical protein [Pontibacter arcticus]RAU82614.1 hypothetical protein DP923_12680 [Pontibacter arcticus]